MLLLEDNPLALMMATTDSTIMHSNPVMPADTVHQKIHELVQQAYEDPNSFLQNLTESLVMFGLKVLAAIAIYILGIWLIGHLKKLLTRIFERRKTERTLASFITSLVSITLTVMLFVTTISTIGVDTSSFAALLTAGGLAIGMALSGTVQNFAGGIMLLIFHPFRAGDYIRTQGHEGRVMEINMVSTKILTYNNMVVIIPNGSLSTSNIENVFAQPTTRIEWRVSVQYGVDAAACRQAMLDIVLSDKRILTSRDKRPELGKHSGVNLKNVPIPDPVVVLDSLNANDITFVVKAWVHSDQYWNVKHEMLERFYTELPPQGFGFAYPHMDVTLLNQKG